MQAIGLDCNMLFGKNHFVCLSDVILNNVWHLYPPTYYTKQLCRLKFAVRSVFIRFSIKFKDFSMES